MITTSFPRWKGDSAGKFVFELSYNLAKANNNVIVISPHQKGVKKEEVMSGIKVHRFRYAPQSLEMEYGKWYSHEWTTSFRKKLEYFFKLAFLPFFIISGIISTIDECKKNNIDIIMSHWSFPNGFIGYISSKILGKRHIIKAYGGDVIVLSKKPVLKQIIRFVLNKSDLVMTNSHETKKDVERLGINQKKIKVIYEAVSTERFNSNINSNKIREGLDLKSTEKVILSIGRLIPYKGYEYLIDAASKVIAHEPDVKFLIGGEGPLRNDLQQQIAKLDLMDKVTLLGFIPEDELPLYYSACDIYVSSSIYDTKGNREGFGVTIVEAMATGKPVIITDAGAPKEYVINEYNGLIAREKDPIDLAKKILTCLNDPALCKKMGKNGGKTVEKKFKWDNIVTNIENEARI